LEGDFSSEVGTSALGCMKVEANEALGCMACSGFYRFFSNHSISKLPPASNGPSRPLMNLTANTQTAPLSSPAIKYNRGFVVTWLDLSQRLFFGPLWIVLLPAFRFR
jgi:hypothetical protein